MKSTLRTLTAEHLGQSATDADLAAFRRTARAAMASGMTEAEAIEWTWNDGAIRTETALAARALRAIPSEARSEQSRANGRRGGRRLTVYTLSSVKGEHGTVSGYRAACARAREVQSDMQAAYGVDVHRPDGHLVYTAF